MGLDLDSCRFGLGECPGATNCQSLEDFNNGPRRRFLEDFKVRQSTHGGPCPECVQFATCTPESAGNCDHLFHYGEELQRLENLGFTPSC